MRARSVATKRPPLTYERYNLVAACQLCNEEIKKENNTVTRRLRTYKKLKFRIVHPILDVPKNHIKIGKGFTVKGLTKKGKESIKFFELTGTRRMRARRGELVQDRIDNLPPATKAMVERALKI